MPDIFVAEHKNPKTALKETKNTDQKSADLIGTYNEKSARVHLFSSYCEDPDDITFENQEENENILLFIRKDLITNFPWIFLGLVFCILPFILTPFLIYFHFPIFILPAKFNLIFLIFYYLIIAIYFFVNFIAWYFNIDIVTKQRVIDVDFRGLVYKNIAATKISLIQDVSYSQVGVLRTIFNYGDVFVQTAGTIDHFTFQAIPKPEDAVHIVENLIGKHNE